MAKVLAIGSISTEQTLEAVIAQRTASREGKWMKKIVAREMERNHNFT